MPTQKLTAHFCSTVAAPKTKDREIYWDASMPGFGVMVTQNNARSFVIQYRDTGGSSHRMSVNGNRDFAEAKKEAKRLLGKIANGSDPLADKRKAKLVKAGTLHRIVEDEYLTDDDIVSLRSIDERRKTFRNYILPTFGSTPIAQIKRSEIVRLLSKIKQKNGPGAANVTYQALASFFAWYAKRDDEFRSPIVKGTYKMTASDGSRTLTTDEIRIMWNVASEGTGVYDSYIRFTLLTASRLNESAQMPRA
jgi:hypothetical protein